MLTKQMFNNCEAMRMLQEYSAEIATLYYYFFLQINCSFHIIRGTFILLVVATKVTLS